MYKLSELSYFVWTRIYWIKWIYWICSAFC